MAIDRREMILARLTEALGELDEVEKAARNVNLLSESARPAAIVYDADEAAADSDPIMRPIGSPRLVSMTPEVHILLTEEQSKSGTAVNVLRTAILKKVLSDPALESAVSSVGHIRYDGLITDFADGRKLEARMRIGFTFTYVLQLRDL